MKHKTLVSALAYLCLSVSFSFAQFSPSSSTSTLKIYSPDWWSSWYPSNGLITEASLLLEPQGAFVRCDMTMIFSSTHLWNDPDDSLEVEYIFNLPKGCIGFDSWLWIENYISYGIVLDVDSATWIYEDIVDRKTDPSLLRKRNATQYGLRIYPITANDPRKVKLSFLIPTEWSKEHVMMSLPVGQILPFFSGDHIEVLVKQDSNFQQPMIIERPELLAVSDSNGQYLRFDLEENSPAEDLTLIFDSPLSQQGVYASYVSSPTGEQTYQLAVLPSDFLPIPSSKYLILMDYEAENSAEISPMVRTALQQHLSPTDSFNVMMNTANGIQAIGTDWLPATHSLLDMALDSSILTISGQSNLLDLLRAGKDFMDTHNNEGSILLISNSDTYFGYFAGNELLDSLEVGGFFETPVHIACHQRTEFESFWDEQFCGNRCGNEYAFNLIATQTGGSLTNLRTATLPLYRVLTQAITMAGPQIGGVDHYSNIDPDAHQVSCYYTQPMKRAYVEIGSYSGSLPSTPMLVFVDSMGMEQIDIPLLDSDLEIADTLLHTAWIGRRVQEMEFNASLRDSIVNLCIEERLLSYYTAFLCLEDTASSGFQTRNESASVAIDEPVDILDDRIQVFPNPFHTETRILISEINPQHIEQTQLILYDLTGKLVMHFVLSRDMMHGEAVELYWDGRDLQGQEVPNGVYLLVMKRPDEQESIRVRKQ